MSGLVKPKTYDWKDSNVALIGSDTDKQVKKESAATEPAWKNAGQKVGLKIWRIVKFKVADWPEKDYGKFYGGDSYIILNTFKPNPASNELAYDLHFWIGSQSTQDEYGTAAYKTVELDTFLDDKPVQHREVEGYESNLFKSYFPKGLTVMAGGAESGFNQVKPTEYQPRLLHFCGTKQNIVVQEVALNAKKLLSDDVYILDLGLTFYQWNGSGSNKDERYKAVQYLQTLKSERNNSSSETLDEADTPKSHPFYQALTGADEPDHIHAMKASEKILLRVSDESGHLKQTEVKKGPVKLNDFDSKDVFILDTGDNCFVWVGKGASQSETQNGFGYALGYLMKTDHPLVPVHIIKEGQANKDFSVAVAA
jgi:gelsolin